MSEEREKFVLCRHDISENIGDPKKYCAKIIKTSNPLDWCDECYAKRLQWPTAEAPVQRQILVHVGDFQETTS